MFKLVEAQGYLPSSFFLRNVGEHASPFIDSGPSNPICCSELKGSYTSIGTLYEKYLKNKKAHSEFSKAARGNICNIQRI